MLWGVEVQQASEDHRLPCCVIEWSPYEFSLAEAVHIILYTHVYSSLSGLAVFVLLITICLTSLYGHKKSIGVLKKNANFLFLLLLVY